MQVNKLLTILSHLLEQLVIFCKRDSRKINLQKFSILCSVNIRVKNGINVIKNLLRVRSFLKSLFQLFKHLWRNIWLFQNIFCLRFKEHHDAAEGFLFRFVFWLIKVERKKKCNSFIA